MFFRVVGGNDGVNLLGVSILVVSEERPEEDDGSEHNGDNSNRPRPFLVCLLLNALEPNHFFRSEIPRSESLSDKSSNALMTFASTT